MTFTRTVSGLIAKYLFYREVIVWVEGFSDFTFYERILRKLPCRLENAGGKDKCLKLAEALVENDYPYVVVIDGDYDILEKTRSVHRRIILLHRYSIENYFFEKEPIEQVCRNYSNVGGDENLVGDVFEAVLESLKTALFELVILDIANHKSGTGLQVLPDRAEPLLDDVTSLTFAHDQITRHCTQCRGNIDQSSIAKAQTLLEKFLERKRFVDILRGHFIFSILRNLIINLVRQKMGRNPNIDNQGLTILLSTEVWNLSQSHDHKSLKRRLYQAVNEAYKMRVT